MFKNALIKRSQQLLSLSALAVITACSGIPHDEDSLYIHGFIAPLGDTVLSNTEAGKDLKISLRKGGKVISEQQIKSAEHWPAAYKLEFHPPQLEQSDDNEENTDDLKISLTIETDASNNTLIYQKKITLDSPKLFSTGHNILVTPFSIEKPSSNDTDSAEKKKNEDAYNALFTDFNCEDTELKAAMNMRFIVIAANNEIIIPRSLTAPEPVFILSDTRLQFPQGQKFTYQQGKKTSQCDLAQDHFNPWQEAQDLAKQAEAKQIAADKKASNTKVKKP